MSKRTHATKALSMLLALILVLSLFPIMGASAANKGEFSAGQNVPSMNVGDTATLNDSEHSGYTFNWTSSNTNAVKIQSTSNTSAVIQAVGTGSATISSGASFMGIANATTWTITVTSGGSTPSTPTPQVPTDGSKTVSGVTAITVNKSWSGSGAKQPVTIGLYSGSSRVASHVLQTSETSYTFSGLDSSKTYYIKEETTNSAWTTSYADPNTSTSSGSAGWVEQSKGAVEAGKTYAFTYTSNGTTYLLGRSGTSVVGSTSGLTGGTPNANIGNDYKWQISSASSRYGDWYLKNLGNNYYLSVGNGYFTGYQPGSYFNNSASSMYSAMHLDDDGSIWNGYSPGYNLYASGTSVGADSSSFTVFTPWLYSSSASTKTASYTITNTFVQSNNWTVTYNANGHGTAPAAQSVTKGQSVTLPTMNAEGWIFKGWATSADGTPISGTSYTPNADVTLYAIWEKDASVTAEDGLTVSKTADKAGQTIDTSDEVTLEMEAYATGTTVTVVTPGQSGDPEPVDVLLLLDTSATMQSENRFQNMKDAANEFVRTLAGMNANSKVSVIAYGQYDEYTKLDYETSEDTTKGLPLWRELSNNGSNVQGIINGLSYHLGGNYSYGTGHAAAYALAKTAFNSVNDGRKHYVINISDGVFDYSTTPYYDTADATALKNGGVEIYYITVGSSVDSYKVSTLASAPASTYVFDGGSGGAAIAGAMTTIGQAIEIETQSSSTSVTLDKGAVFQDVINTEKFDVSGATATVTIYDYNSNKQWSPLTSYAISAGAGGSATKSSWTNKSTNDGTLTLNFGANGTITVTGFSYKDHYLPTNGTEAQNVNAQKVHLTVSGLKLKADAQTTSVQSDVPTNVEASSGVFAKSGDPSPAVPFPVPTVNIAALPEYTYYAKLVYDANGGLNPPAAETKNVTTTESSAAVSFDQGTPNPTRSGFTFKGWSTNSGENNTVNVTFPYMITTSKTTEATAETKTLYAVWEQNYNDPVTVIVDYSMKYEIATDVKVKPDDITGGSFSLDGTTLYFTPAMNKSTAETTTNTETSAKAKNVTYDFSAFSTAQTVTVTHNNGSMTNVTIVPANSIFFDDSTGTGTLSAKTANDANGDGYQATITGTTGTDTFNNADKVQKIYFTFTGKRIDAYCTTSAGYGTVIATLYSGSGKDACVFSNAVTPIGHERPTVQMQNHSTDTRLNVPTLSFEADSVDTYTLLISVPKGVTYQLDGVRVYNPADNDTNAQAEYAKNDLKEQNATYTSLRSLLLTESMTGYMTDSNGTRADGIGYFVDTVTEGAEKSYGTSVTATLETYKTDGPKNELYLEPGTGIAFTIDNYSNVKNAKIMVGLSVQGSGTAYVKLSGNA